MHLYFGLASISAALVGTFAHVLSPVLANVLNPLVYQWLKKSDTWLGNILANLPAQFHPVAIALLGVVVPQLVALIPGLSASTVADLATPSNAAIVTSFAIAQLTHLLMTNGNTSSTPSPKS